MCSTRMFGDFGGARQQIVGQRRRQWLALFVKRHLFVQGAANALSGAAENLSIDDHWIDERTGILSHNVIENLHRSGFGIDRNDGRMSGPGVDAREA